MYDVVWPQYLAARGYGPLIIGLSVSLFALPILVLARAGGRLADRADRRKLVTAGLVVVAACAATYPFLQALAVILTVGSHRGGRDRDPEPSLFAVIGDSTPGPCVDGRWASGACTSSAAWPSGPRCSARCTG